VTQTVKLLCKKAAKKPETTQDFEVPARLSTRACFLGASSEFASWLSMWFNPFMLYGLAGCGIASQHRETGEYGSMILESAT